MSLYILGAAIVLFCYELYRRYFPIKGITCKHIIDDKDIVILDMRDYNEKSILINALTQIPYAYLRRYYLEIPDKPIHVVTSNQIDLHLGVRFLLRKGYQVSSFEILDCKCGREGGK